MKNILTVLFSSLLSAFLAIFIYKQFEPAVATDTDSARNAAKYTTFNEGSSKGTVEPPLGSRMAAGTPKIHAAAPTQFTDAAAQVTPTVVNIKSYEKSRGFSWLGQGISGGVSSGSGVIISEDGYIVTNNHVIEDGTRFEVTLNDKQEFEASLVGHDASTDLALLKIEADGLPFARFGNSDSLRIGEWVLAVGNPFNLESTVTAGIVSAKGRNIDILEGEYSIESFIQTDAAINPGNSGGALVDMAGRLVGINTAILTRSGGSNGIGFAIPADLVKAVVEQALSGQTEFQRPWAGVNGQAVDAAMAEAMDLARPSGVLLSELHAQSPFRAAGLLPGDVVTEIAGEPVNSPQEMIFRLAAMGIGGTTDTAYLRDGETRHAAVALAPAPDLPPSASMAIGAGSALEGLTVARINPAVIARLGLPLAAEGVVVTAAEALAARAGFQPGDILMRLNGETVASPADVARMAAGGGRRWQVDLVRAGRLIRLRFRI
ncbi:MAG: trypsin-like peptidase domain-containing protein [Phaeodactylibacter sp.]|nr:trypsin-like peptidase domain-containing protein [Phaeodactylibacter sp.]